MHLVRTRRPTATCVTVQQVAANKRVSATDEGELIALWIQAAEDAIERRTNRSIMAQSFRLHLPIVRPTLTLFRPPMEGDIKITAASSAIDGAAAVDADISKLVGGVSSMLPTVTFPYFRRVEAGTLAVEYDSGATKPDGVPPAIRQAVMLLASHWYSNREATSLDPRARGDTNALPFGVDYLISPFRIPNVNIAVNEAY